MSLCLFLGFSVCLKIPFKLTLASFMWITVTVLFFNRCCKVICLKYNNIIICPQYKFESRVEHYKHSKGFCKSCSKPSSVHVNILHSAVTCGLAGRWMFTSSVLGYQPLTLIRGLQEEYTEAWVFNVMTINLKCCHIFSTVLFCL